MVRSLESTTEQGVLVVRSPIGRESYEVTGGVPSGPSPAPAPAPSTLQGVHADPGLGRLENIRVIVPENVELHTLKGTDARRLGHLMNRPSSPVRVRQRTRAPRAEALLLCPCRSRLRERLPHTVGNPPARLHSPQRAGIAGPAGRLHQERSHF